MIYQLSIELDEIIAQYYTKNNKKTSVGSDIEGLIVNENEKKLKSLKLKKVWSFFKFDFINKN